MGKNTISMAMFNRFFVCLPGRLSTLPPETPGSQPGIASLTVPVGPPVGNQLGNPQPVARGSFRSHEDFLFLTIQRFLGVFFDSHGSHDYGKPVEMST